MRVVRRFLPEEDEFIRANASKLTTKEIGLLLNKAHSSVICRVKFLKLKTFEDLEGEVWKLSVVDRHLKYYVSNKGRVCRDMWRLIASGKSKLVPGKNNTQYYQFSTGRDSFRTCHKLHREVARLFIREPFPNEQVNHINGNGLDNRLDNLEWLTPGQNATAAIDLGLRRTKLNFSIATEIRSLNFSTIKQAQAYVKKKYQIEVTYGCIRDTIRSVNWNRGGSSTSL